MGTNMKILEVIARYPPSVGGSQKVCEELSKQFSNKGHEVTVVTSTSLTNTDTFGFTTSRLFNWKTHGQIGYEHINGIDIYRFEPLIQFFPYLYNPNMGKWLKHHIKEYDVIHVHGYQTYEADIISKLNVPYILTAHDVIAHYDGILGQMKKVFDIIKGKRILHNATTLIALTKENIKQYNDIIDCKDKIKLIPDGIESFKKRKKSKTLLKKYNNPEHVVLFVGRIVKYKGCQYIIKSINDVIKDYSNTKFIFVGQDQGYQDELMKLSHELNVGEYCVFAGKVDNLEEYYNLADVFVLPSKGEGFGLTAVEAMSVGTPTILADMGGLKYVLKDIGGYKINMCTNINKQISNYITKIFKDKHINTNELIQKTKSYSWDAISDKHLELFKK